MTRYILKKEILPIIIKWQKERKYPFVMSTQTSINLSDDQELMEIMTYAGFATVFVGIETPDPDGLAECGKFHNKNRNLLESVKKIQNMGFEVKQFIKKKIVLFYMKNLIRFVLKGGENDYSIPRKSSFLIVSTSISLGSI